MPVWLTLFIALVGTIGFFGSLYFLVFVVVEGKRAGASPKMGLAQGEKPGTVGFWMTWDTGQFGLSVYRIKVTLASPESALKESVFSVTYDPPQKSAFFQSIEIPAAIAKFIQETPARKTLISYEARAVENVVLANTVFAGRFREIASGAKKVKVPKIANRLPVAVADLPWVSTLDYQELVVRTKKIREMEAAAKAKAAKAAAAKAPAAAAVPAPETAT